MTHVVISKEHNKILLKSKAMSIVLPSITHLSEREAANCIQLEQSAILHTDMDRCMIHSNDMARQFAGGNDLLFSLTTVAETFAF